MLTERKRPVKQKISRKPVGSGKKIKSGKTKRST